MAERRRRVRSDSLANRDRILRTAARLFGERGVDVPLDEIAAASGVGSATLHRHFRGRVELVHSVLDAEAARLAERADELLSGRGPRALRIWLRELIQFSMSFRGLAVLLADHDADTTLPARHHALTDACRRLLVPVRPDSPVDAGDLLKLANGIAVAAGGSVDTADRLLALVTDGLPGPAAGTGSPRRRVRPARG